MNTQKSTSGRSYKDILVQAVHSLANSTGLQTAIEAIEPKQRVGADAIVNVRDANKRWRFYVEVKPQLTKLLTQYLKPKTVTIYSESNLPKLQAQHGLRRDSNGEIELLRRFWKFDQWEKKSLQTAPPLLVYADLLSTADDRNLETAEIIYEQYSARLVE